MSEDFDDIWKDVEKKEKTEEKVEEKSTVEEQPKKEETPKEEKTEEAPKETTTEEQPSELSPEELSTQEGIEVPIESQPEAEETTVKKSTDDIWGEKGEKIPTVPASTETTKTEIQPTEKTSEEIFGTEQKKEPYYTGKPLQIDEATLIAEVGGEKYDLHTDKGTTKEVYTVYGFKGEGKTGLAFSFPGKVVCLSFDRKSVQVLEQMYQNNPRIIVYDAIRYLDKSSGPQWLKTSDKTLTYVNLLLDTVIKEIVPDWIVIDGTEIFTTLCEMVMRYRNDLMPFQGIKNLNLWKERRMHIDQIHNKCIALAKKGIIYTTYTRKDDIVEDGQFVVRKDVPKWIDAIMYYTDTVIRVKCKDEKGGRKFIAIVESSKTNKMRTGKVVDITNGGYTTIVGD